MKIDLSFKVEKKMLEEMSATARQLGQLQHDAEKAGHVGTHFDAMDKEFSIENIITKGRIFDISHIKTGELKVEDLDLSNIEKNDFVMFYSGISKKYRYGTKEYFTKLIKLSDEVIDFLIDKEVNFIGVDMHGVQAGPNHARIDQYCADKGVFIIENLDNLDILLKESAGKSFTVYTFPTNTSGFSGIPCRVIAEIETLK